MFLFSFYFALTADMDYVMSQNPNIYYLLILLGAISGIALIAQILSSTLVPINVLGLLTYFEPIMMLFVSFAIGERLEKSSYFLMICLAISVTLLMIDSINSIKGDKNTKTK
jgi:protein RarD